MTDNGRHSLTYNTDKADLIISEYGRHIQKMTQYLCTLEDKDKRQRGAERLIRLMHLLNPQKHTEDYTNKLWKHLLRISDYQLDVDLPEGVTPERVDLKARRVRLPYPDENKTFRHYGHYVQQLIDKAEAMEDIEKKEEFLFHIGSFMKQSYATSARSSDVSDDMICADIAALSKGKLSVGSDVKFGEVELPPEPKRHPSTKRRRGGKGRK